MNSGSILPNKSEGGDSFEKKGEFPTVVHQSADVKRPEIFI